MFHRLDGTSGKVIRAEVIECLQNRRVALGRVVELDGGISENELVAQNCDPAPVTQGDRLKRGQAPTIELGAAFAFKVHKVRRTIGPVLDPGMTPRHPGVIEVDVKSGNSTDVEIGSSDLIHSFGPPAPDQLKRRSKRKDTAHASTFAPKRTNLPEIFVLI